jgi:hypothetical protein
MALYNGLKRTNYKFKFSEICLKHFLSAYMENTHSGKKVLKLSKAEIVIEQHETNFKSSLPIP